MPSLVRTLVLLAVLVGGLVASRTLGAEHADTVARWPTDDGTYSVPGWTAGPLVLEVPQMGDRPGAVLSRAYHRVDDDIYADLALWTVPQPRARMLFRKGPDRDYQGAGFTIEPAPATVFAPRPGRDALIARRGSEAYLLVYAFGERRGLLGAGPNAWVVAELDGLLDTPNHYFLARVSVPLDWALEHPTASADLADTLVGQLADWYQH